jgi:hypothetical protein
MGDPDAGTHIVPDGRFSHGRRGHRRYGQPSRRFSVVSIATQAVVSTAPASFSNRLAHALRGYRNRLVRRDRRTGAPRGAHGAAPVHRSTGGQSRAQRSLVVIVLQSTAAGYLRRSGRGVGGKHSRSDPSCDWRPGSSRRTPRSVRGLVRVRDSALRPHLPSQQAPEEAMNFVGCHRTLGPRRKMRAEEMIIRAGTPVICPRAGSSGLSGPVGPGLTHRLETGIPPSGRSFAEAIFPLELLAQPRRRRRRSSSRET